MTRSPAAIVSSAVNTPCGAAVNSAVQAARTAAGPTWRLPSGGAVSSKTQVVPHDVDARRVGGLARR